MTESSSPDTEGDFAGSSRDSRNQENVKEKLARYEWLLEKEEEEEGTSATAYVALYPDLTALNTSRVILDAVGSERLYALGKDLLELLGTSVAVYEANGDYAFGLFVSGWCQTMDRASYLLCDTDEAREALSCGSWLCHENCWNDSARAAMETLTPTDIECVGGIRLYAVPIRADGEVVGAINMGYGTPPEDPATLQRLAKEFKVDPEELRLAAKRYKPRPDFIIQAAKRRCSLIAETIGFAVERKRHEAELLTVNQQLRATEQQLQAANQQLRASNQQLRASNQQQQATEQELRNLNQRLESGNRRLNEAQRIGGMGDWRWDPESDVVTWSENLYQLMGLDSGQPPPGVEGNALLYHPDDREKFRETVGVAVERGEPFSMELRRRRPDGQDLVLISEGRVEKNSAGEVTDLYGTVLDITHRKAIESELARAVDSLKASNQQLRALEQQLRASNEQLHQSNEDLQFSRSFLATVLEQSPFAMWVADPTGTVIQTNRALRTSLNLSDDQIVGEYRVMEDANLEIQGVMSQVKAVFQEHEPTRFAILWRAGDTGHADFERGRDLQIDVSMFPIVSPNGDLEYVVCQWVDITEQEELKAWLETERKESQWLLDSMINAFVTFDSVFDENGMFASYRFVYINRAFEQITGVTLAEVKGKTVHQVWPGTEDAWIERYGAAATTGETQSFEMYHAPTGKLYSCIAYRPWDTPDRFCVVFEDVSERRKVAEDLENARTELEDSHEALRGLTHRLQAIREQEREELARDLHDDLGEALTILRMDLAQVQKSAKTEAPPLEAELTSLIRRADIASDLLRNYCLNLHSPVLDLMGLGAALLSHMESVAERSDLDFEISVNDKDLDLGYEIEINLFRIAQEALSNVLQHSGALRVRVRFQQVESGAVELEVSDDGVGIPLEGFKAERSMGILGMRERALSIGAELDVGPSATGGTRVHLVLEPGARS